MSKEETEKKEIQKTERPVLPMTALGFQPTDMDSACRQADWMAKSSMVGPEYRNNPANCLFLLEMSMGLGVRWQLLMQHIYMVHDRPALDAQITIGLVNRSALFTDPLEYEVVGDDPGKKDYKVRAYATRTATKKVLHGPWITWQLISGEGWDKRNGSKWLTMPEQMFHYRAASWFANRHCPEVKMGMMTVDEAEEVPRKQVESVTFPEAQQQSEEQIDTKTGSEPMDTQFEETEGIPESPQEQESGDDNSRPAFLEDTEGEKEAKAKAEDQKKKLAEAPAAVAGHFVCKNRNCANKGVVFENPKMIKKGKTMVPQCGACLGTNIEAVEA